MIQTRTATPSINFLKIDREPPSSESAVCWHPLIIHYQPANLGPIVRHSPRKNKQTSPQTISVRDEDAFLGDHCSKTLRFQTRRKLDDTRCWNEGPLFGHDFPIKSHPHTCARGLDAISVLMRTTWLSNEISPPFGTSCIWGVNEFGFAVFSPQVGTNIEWKACVRLAARWNAHRNSHSQQVALPEWDFEN